MPTFKQLLKSKKEIDEIWPRHQALMPDYSQQLKLHVEKRLTRLVTNKTLTAPQVDELQEKLGLFAVNLFYDDKFNLETDFKKYRNLLPLFC